MIQDIADQALFFRKLADAIENRSVYLLEYSFKGKNGFDAKSGLSQKMGQDMTMTISSGLDGMLSRLLDPNISPLPQIKSQEPILITEAKNRLNVKRD